MNKFDEPLPVKLVCGVLYHEQVWLDRALRDLEIRFGPRDFLSGPIDFRFTDYYFEEMGQPLFRQFVSFEKLMNPAELMDVKVITNELEQEYASGPSGKRRMNIDPGYLSATAFILATSKNYAHRIYLGKGVFAQQELLFERKRIQTLDWTYPDYRSYEYQEVFKRIRENYLGQLKILQK